MLVVQTVQTKRGIISSDLPSFAHLLTSDHSNNKFNYTFALQHRQLEPTAVACANAWKRRYDRQTDRQTEYHGLYSYLLSGTVHNHRRSVSHSDLSLSLVTAFTFSTNKEQPTVTPTHQLVCSYGRPCRKAHRKRHANCFSRH